MKKHIKYELPELTLKSILQREVNTSFDLFKQARDLAKFMHENGLIDCDQFSDVKRSGLEFMESEIKFRKKYLALFVELRKYLDVDELITA